MRTLSAQASGLRSDGRPCSRPLFDVSPSRNRWACRWGTILYCLRLTSEITVIMKLAVSTGMPRLCCESRKVQLSAGKRSVSPATRVISATIHYHENGPQQFHIIALFFASTFIERHAHSMAKRDDLVPCRLRSFCFRSSTAVDRQCCSSYHQTLS